MEKIFIKSIKEQFVPAEFSLLTQWASVLEREAKGTGWVYLQLQVGINREPGNKNFGKSWQSMERIAERCGSDRRYVSDRVQILEKYGFITAKRNNHQNTEYTILDVPEFIEQNTNKTLELPCVSDELPIEDPVMIEDKKRVRIDDVEGVFNTGFSLTSFIKSKLQKSKEEIESIDLGLWSCHTLLKYFKIRYAEKFEFEFAGKLTAKDAHIYKIFIEELGITKAVQVVDYAIENWNEFSKAGVFPTPGYVYTLRNGIAPIITNSKLAESKKIDRSIKSEGPSIF